MVAGLPLTRLALIVLIGIGVVLACLAVRLLGDQGITYWARCGLIVVAGGLLYLRVRVAVPRKKRRLTPEEFLRHLE